MISARSAASLCAQELKSEIIQNLVGSSGLEPPTSRLSGVRSNHLSYEPINDLVCRFPLTPFYSLSRVGGDERDRTDDPLLAKQVLSQLSYTPKLSPEDPFSRPSKLNNDLIKSPELTLDVKSVMFQTD